VSTTLSSKIHITCVVGTRPNFVKMASIIDALRQRDNFAVQLVHTGQHFSPEMSEAFFEELELPAPDVNLNVGQGSQTEQTAEIMRRLEPILLNQRPDQVLVVGDVNSTLATALVAAKIGIPLVHVEAGLRSFDRGMPEEINRIITDALSDSLFVSEPSGVENLLAEGVSRSRIHFVGNVMIDTLLRFREKAARSRVLERLGVESRGFVVTTLHRPSNVDNPQSLRGFVEMLVRVAGHLPVIFPVHPRTVGRIQAAGLDTAGLILTSPLGYLDFLHLMSQARLMLTDSGGIQEETTILGVPCLTTRDNTERPITIHSGTNRLVGTDPRRILSAVWDELDRPFHAIKTTPELWDGKAALRIAQLLEHDSRPATALA
jgi:UDP-N-acetylglucosamine 2-epimerase (non-hydrolysing)